MKEFRSYIKERITKLTAYHNSLKNSEAEFKESNTELADAFNSQAAATWDTKCEVENMLREFDRCTQMEVNAIDKQVD